MDPPTLFDNVLKEAAFFQDYFPYLLSEDAFGQCVNSSREIDETALFLVYNVLQTDAMH